MPMHRKRTSLQFTAVGPAPGPAEKKKARPPPAPQAIAQSRMDPSWSHLVVIGASAGGVTALLDISSRLPRFFAAPICIVQHVGNNPSLLPELLRYRGSNHALHVEDGQRLSSGTLHVAPPDHHVLVQGNTLWLTHGPKENHARPAIDPLFRTAALSWGPRVIGVILTGQMDDGSAGLRA